MLILRQKEYVVNPLKNAGRKAIRNIKNMKTQLKFANGGYLNNQEVGEMAANLKLASKKVVNGKPNLPQKMVMKREGITAEELSDRLNKAGKRLQGRYNAGKGF